MNFPNLPHRSDSDDDALDQMLNAWANGASPETASDLAADALDFHRWADDVRRADLAAKGPAAGTWNRVLRQSAQQSRRRQAMSYASVSTAPQAAIVHNLRLFNRQQISRYLNFAASLVIVFGVAFAGAFTAMQLNQPGGSNGQFAFLSQTDGAGTCDVEPLSAERVMDIVKNPYPFMHNGPAGEPVEPANPDSPWATGLHEAGGWDLFLFTEDSSQSPNDEVFESSSEFADAYLQCLVYGTLGQAWIFHSPYHIQQDVLYEFPVFADEETVRERVEERLLMPARDVDSLNFWGRPITAYDPATVAINADPNLALQRQVRGSSFQSLVTFGVEFMDIDGRTIYLTSATGNEMVRNPNGSTYYMTISTAWYSYSESWYIVPYWAP